MTLSPRASAVLLAHWGGEREPQARDLKREFPHLSDAEALELIDQARKDVRERDEEIDRLADAEERGGDA